ncbi:NYN domain-containing protein [Modestobacter excelsi]|uniref:NYN domain-containing protein n=1 Tax=Modestobacter excelsi TaxID=2213161 RepID=UPI00110CB87C|nr:NYN domain-containing protein [Modestobacter excelsi]
MAFGSGYRRTALLVDFDNIYSSLRSVDPAAARIFATDPMRWSSWLEERLGAVGPDSDETTPRVVLHRTCYLNPSTWGSFRAYFTRAGFRVVDCPTLTQQGKNSADIHMVIDALDLLAHPTRYDEFIVLSLDADFTPLFQRLRSFDRRVIMLGSGPSAAALRNTCDYVIPDDVFIAEALMGEEAVAVADAPPAATQDVAPTPGASDPLATPRRADPDRMRRDLRNALVAMVTEAPEPLRMAFAAGKLRDRFGPEVTAGQWAGTGGFKAFVQSVADERLACRVRGVVGFVYQPGRHDIDAAMARAEESSARPRVPQDTERFAGLWADAAARVCRVLGFPALLPSEWAGIFTGIADELTAHGFRDMATLERVVAGSAGELRASVRFVGVGLSQAGYDLASRDRHTARAVGGCFHSNMLRLAENAQLHLDEPDHVALRDWVLGGLIGSP